MNSSTPSSKRIHQPLNVYNIYFILERRRLIQEMEGPGETAAVQHQEESCDLAGYELLPLPDLPHRFHKLQLPCGWFVPGKNLKRKHVRSHGLTSFAELARTVAKSWKSIDSETKDYCLTVASILKERHAELSKAEGIGCLPMSESTYPGPKKKTKPQHSNNITKNSKLLGGLWCLPTNEHDGVELIQPNPPDLNQQEVRMESALPTGHISVEMLHHMPPGFIRHVEMLQQMLPGLNQHGGQNRSVPILTGGDGYNELKFPIVSNVNRRATISNMKLGFGSFKEQPNFQMDALRHDENGFFQEGHMQSSATDLLMRIQEKQLDAINGVQKESALPNTGRVSVEMIQQMPTDLYQHGGQNRSVPTMTGNDGYNELEYPVVTNVNRRATISNMMVGIGSFEKQPNFRMDELRRSSAPELLESIQEKQYGGKYNVQELDIPDSDIVGMWDQDRLMKQMSFAYS